MKPTLGNPDPKLEALLPQLPFSPRPGPVPDQVRRDAGLGDDFLPSDTSVLGKLWNLLHSDDSSIEDCGDVIKLDPALTARGLPPGQLPHLPGQREDPPRGAPPPGPRHRPAGRLQHQILQRFSNLHPPAGWEFFWLRNLLVGQVAERLAATYFRPTGAEYLSGLLHDTGWLLLAGTFPEEFNALFASPKPLQEAEQEVLSFTHAEISAAICAKSFLDPRIVGGVLNHHRPEFPSDRKFNPVDSAPFLSVLLYLADQIADSRGMLLRPGEPKPTIEQIAECPARPVARRVREEAELRRDQRRRDGEGGGLRGLVLPREEGLSSFPAKNRLHRLFRGCGATQTAV